MTSGNLAQWKVKVGDAVKASSLLAEIETDKATVDFECQDEGFVAKLLVDAGAQGLPVGKPIAVLCENAEDVRSFAEFRAEEPSAPAVSSPPAPPAPPAAKTATAAADQPAAAKPPVQTQTHAAGPSQPKPVAAAAVPPPPPPPAPAKQQSHPPLSSASSPLDAILREERLAYQAKYGDTLLFRG